MPCVLSYFCMLSEAHAELTTNKAIMWNRQLVLFDGQQSSALLLQLSWVNPPGFLAGSVQDSSHCNRPFHSMTQVVFAEGVMTNGSGMVQFSRGFMRFGRSLPIVPVALRVTVPWNIQTHTLTSNFAANLFWFCFVPRVRLDATVLKPMSLSEVRHAH